MRFSRGPFTMSSDDQAGPRCSPGWDELGGTEATFARRIHVSTFLLLPVLGQGVAGLELDDRCVRGISLGSQ